MQEKGYSGDDSYALSKLASMMFTYDLADLMKPKGVTVNCLDPGTVNTKLLIAGWGACGIDIKVVTVPALSADYCNSTCWLLHVFTAVPVKVIAGTGLTDKVCSFQLKVTYLASLLAG